MTLPPILGSTYARPLEREFEAWVVREIEDYFSNLGVRVRVWAVSPTLEKTWPSDEALTIDGKLLGLQFKQAQLATGAVDFDRLKWSLREPRGQYELVQRRPEIFYALPTFINRMWARSSLNHCLFWRPPDGVIDYNAWYDNPAAHTPHQALAHDVHALRWGALVEGVIRCNLGLRIRAAFNLRRYVAGLGEEAGADIVRGDNDVVPTSLLFIVAIPLA